MMVKKKNKWLVCILSCLFPLMAMGATTPVTTPPASATPPTTPTPLVSVSATKPITTYPVNQDLYDLYPWSLTYYYGQTVNNPLVDVLFLHDLQHWPEHIQTVELAHTLTPDNPVRRFFSPLVGLVQLAGNVTVRQGNNENTIYEFDPYIVFRWANLPWNHYVVTSLALAEGVSYDTSIPAIEKRQNNNTKRFLNYLIAEATFAMPSYPRLQLVTLVHHRSGVYGLYHAGNTGSNDLSVGVRYLFD